MNTNKTEKQITAQVAQWRHDRAEESARMASYLSRLTLPFKAVYGTHKAKKGDLYAVVVHCSCNVSASPFCVKYYTVKKIKDIGLLSYACNEKGGDISTHGRILVGGKYTGFKRIE